MSEGRQSRVRVLGRGLVDSLSIGAGYLPIAFSFGLAALNAKLSATTAILMSVVVYAGASQFALITLLAAGGSFFIAVATALLMNIRHIFYGPVILARMLGGRSHTLPAPLLAFGLTDEVFAATLGKLQRVSEPDRELWYVGLQLGAYLSWVLGTVLGVMLGERFTDSSPLLHDILAFILPALFFALLLEIKGNTRRRILFASAIAAAIAVSFMPAYLAMVVGMLAGAAIGYWSPR